MTISNKEISLHAITGQGLLPLFFYEDAAVSLEIIRTLYKAGVRVLEYTNRGTAALENFRFIKQALQNEMEGLQLGIGTIKNTREAHSFIDAGADFIVCPVVDAEIGKIAHDAGLLWIPGCLTPTEINIAYQHEAALVKVFPANILGPVYISAVKEIFPGQLFIPTGGVDFTQESISAWFKAGVCAVGMGSKLISKEILEKQQYEVLQQKTTELLQLIKICNQ